MTTDRSPHESSEPLGVWCNGYEWVIARDLEDAIAVLGEHYGETLDDIDEAKERDRLRPLPMSESISIFCDKRGNPTSPESDACEEIARTCSEWVAARGRGFLCTTEF